MRSKFETRLMTNKLAVTGLVCCILSTAGCISISDKGYLEEECENGVCTSNREYTAVCVENADGYSECSDSGDINYTRGAANFRQYGERSPRDHRITQAAAGNNISAAIPPSIDNEVVEYESRVVGAPVDNGYAQPANVAQAGVPGNPAAPVPSAPQGGMVPQAAAPQGGAMPPAMMNNAPTAAPYGNHYTQNTQQQGAQTAVQNNNNDEPTEENSTNKDWLAEEGQSLKELLTMWSDEAGWRLIWKTNRNYTLNAGAMFRGNFADVASALVRAFARARPAPIATFYKGNRVLVIETMEDENAYD